MTFSAKLFISVMPDKHCDEIPFSTNNHYLPSSVSLFIILTPGGGGRVVLPIIAYTDDHHPNGAVSNQLRVAAS